MWLDLDTRIAFGLNGERFEDHLLILLKQNIPQLPV